MTKPRIVNKLPKSPKKNESFRLRVHNKKIGPRLITFKATGKKGFGKWQITKNEPVK
jgi:hypothetical protein